jgi:hypothetical protein
MASMPGGRFAVAGELYGPTDFGGGVRSGVGGDTDAFVAEYAPGGALLSFAQYGDSAAQWASAIAGNDRGDTALFATGYGTADFGTGTATPPGWVVGFRASGAAPWVVSSFRGTPAVAIDDQGLVTIGAGLGGPMDLGGGSIGVMNGEFTQHAQFYLASYDTTGKLRWSRPCLEGSLQSLAPQPLGDILGAGHVGSPSLDVGCAPATCS